MWSLKETQAWIVSGGVAAPVVAAPLQNLPPTDPTLPAPRNGESKVSASDKELPTPKHLLSNVWLLDEVKHVLDKGAWAMTQAMWASKKYRGHRVLPEQILEEYNRANNN